MRSAISVNVQSVDVTRTTLSLTRTIDGVLSRGGQRLATHRHTDTRTYRHTDRQTQRHTDTERDRQTDRHRHTDRQDHSQFDEDD